LPADIRGRGGQRDDTMTRIQPLRDLAYDRDQDSEQDR
jgi:hypothetical protein